MKMRWLRSSLDSLHTLVLLLHFMASLGHCDDGHLLSQVLFCQPNEPSSGLLKMFDEDQMFSYNFSDNSISPWIKDFDKWRDQAFPDPSTIFSHMKLCNRFRQALTEALKDITPEAIGGAHVTVFTANPLKLGVTNTLICSIQDVYPPALTITWKKSMNVLKRSLISSKYFAMRDLSFQVFSYLNVTPEDNEVYSCEVQLSGDNRTITEYWYIFKGVLQDFDIDGVGTLTPTDQLYEETAMLFPQYPVPSEMLMNFLCIMGVFFGILFLFLGIFFFWMAKN